MIKKMTRILNILLGIFFMISTSIMLDMYANEVSENTQAIEMESSTGDIKVDAIIPEDVGTQEPLTDRKAPLQFIYSSSTGLGETMLLYNEKTLDVHTYINSVGYVMEYLGVNKKDKNFYNVRFQGGMYAIESTDVSRFLAVDEIESFPHYENVNGIIHHYIEGNPIKTDSWYSDTVLGYAPDWMQEEVQYYSFDGIYFTDTIENLGHKNPKKKKLNRGKPYYSYFQYLPMRTKTSYTAQELNSGFAFLFGQTGFKTQPTTMKSTGQFFIDAEKDYGVNALQFMGIALNESAYGTSGYAVEDNNLFGYNAVDSYPDNADKFPTLKSGISEVANLISWSYADADYIDAKNYYGSHVGTKSSGINVKYASDPVWGEKAASNMFLMDKYLGGKDYGQYTIALAKQKSPVFWDKKRKEKAFVYKESTSQDKYMYSIVIIDDKSTSTITLEPPYSAEKAVGSMDETGGEYNWYDGYMKRSKYKKIEVITSNIES